MSEPALLVGFAFAVLVISAVGTGFVRRFALSRTLLDVPNSRSSHSVPVPRGGGLAMIGAIAIGLLVGWWSNLIATRVTIALLGSSMLVAAVGWWDDHGHVSVPWRSLVHTVAGLWAVAWLGGMPSLDLGGVTVALGWFGSILAVVGIVWSINLYNFMDGIDGIAGVEAVCVGASAALLITSTGTPDVLGLRVVCVIVVGAAAGFLLWNWAPAKIFLGDVGSGTLGAILAVSALASERSQVMPFLVWLLLFGAFFFDATVTLVRRARRGERVTIAHRAHAYQRAAQRWGSHAYVSVSIAAINSVLCVLAWWGIRDQRHAWIPWSLAILLLGGLYVAVELARPMEHNRPSPTS